MKVRNFNATSKACCEFSKKNELIFYDCYMPSANFHFTANFINYILALYLPEGCKFNRESDTELTHSIGRPRYIQVR